MPGPRWKREPRLDDVSVVTTPNPSNSSRTADFAVERDLSAETRRNNRRAAALKE
jgi:hypothetical protein